MNRKAVDSRDYKTSIYVYMSAMHSRLVLPIGENAADFHKNREVKK